jgi:hypothetical protein
MSNARRFQLDELTIRPGTYFNPQTEVMLVVDDSPEVDHEIFGREDFNGADWVLISEDSPLDEHKRDELVDLFEVTYQPAGNHALEGGLDDEDEEDEQDELGVDELGVDEPAVDEHELE